MKRKLVKIGRVDVSAAKGYVFDGCHKIYVCRTWTEVRECRRAGEVVHGMNSIEETYRNSCPLKFINWVDLRTIVPQCTRRVKFTYIGKEK